MQHIMMSRTFALLALASGLPTVWAQTAATVSAPGLGYLLEPESGAVLRIDGIPASAVATADRVASEPKLAHLTMPASGRYTAALDADSRHLLLRPDGAAEFAPLPLSTGGPVKLFALSPSGERLVLTDGYTLQLWSGIPASPQLESTIPLARPEVAALEVSDRGHVALLREAGGELVDADGGLLMDGPVWAMAFRPGADRELLAVRGAEKTLWRANGAELAALADGVGGMDAVRWAANGRIYAVSAKGQAVFEVDGKTGALMQRLECSCTPELLEPLSGEAAFRLTPHRAGEPLWMVDAGSGEARVLFIPVMAPEKGGGSNEDE